ncbi:hypothetical protein [Bacillus sp. CECT 9360]|uniref:hypothetical protein n=1 Tax=Bacillus sp. CECT 9360 TaxID=2845821 RepID=UPI001E32A375|nr:hypothetical protein [Bacillus sp. CECT 9360]CAH0345155.1 hypothetical protein BCI9360_01434 [Bacillus sp. CECT 9360]
MKKTILNTAVITAVSVSLIAPASADAATVSQATSLVSQAEKAGAVLHTLYSTPKRFHVIGKELTTANQAYAKASQAVASLKASSKKTGLQTKLQGVKTKINRTVAFNKAIYSAADSSKKLNELDGIIHKPSINQKTLKPKYDAFVKSTKTLESTIRVLYGESVKRPLYEKYLQPARAMEEMVLDILNDKASPKVLTPTVSGGRTIQIPVSEWSNLDSASVYNKANYTLDGNALPTGTSIKWMKMTPRNVISIILPEAAVTDNQKSTLKVKNLKDQMGNTLVRESDAFPVTLNKNATGTDTVKPELVSVGQLSDEKLRITFSEKMESVNSFDFKITMNGHTIANNGSSGRGYVDIEPVKEDTTGTLYDVELHGYNYFDPDSVTGVDGRIDIENKIYETGPDHLGVWVKTDDYYEGAGPVELISGEITFATLAHTVSTDGSGNRNLLKGGSSFSLTLKKMQ